MQKLLTVKRNTGKEGIFIIFSRNYFRAERYIYGVNLSVIGISIAIIYFL